MWAMKPYSENLHWGGTAIACHSQNTKLPELGFHAVMGDSIREVRFERLLTR
jgi:hypothetical protein